MFEVVVIAGLGQLLWRRNIVRHVITTIMLSFPNNANYCIAARRKPAAPRRRRLMPSSSQVERSRNDGHLHDTAIITGAAPRIGGAREFQDLRSILNSCEAMLSDR